jgi:hypothetical protein
MIDRQALLSDLQSLLQRLESDLLQRSESAEVPDVGQRLRDEYERAKKAERTAQNYEDWRSDAITQAAAAWVLSCVFVRFLEDNRLIDPPKIAGPGKRLQQARDEWELYLAKARQPNERDYLLSVFDELARLPGTKEVFGEHNPIRELPNWLSGDGARDMLGFFQKIDANSAESNKLVHDFTDPAWETRFLGDLYQDLSEAARKKYALLQTPEFVEEFILDRTLEPALNEFGRAEKITRTAQQELPGVNLEGQERLYAPFRMIDPACGSGHFLLGSFRRILDRWQRNEPGVSIRELVRRTLESIHGVDINPYAVAIARFRLLLVAMKACGVDKLDLSVPAFHFNLACGDSLLHGSGAIGTFGFDDFNHVYQAEDHAELVRILKPGHYHAVVANPPYITPKDRALNEAYRERYKNVCHMKYSLSVPFMQRLFQLAQEGFLDTGQGGFVGQITANSFMKREFGKKLIEDYFAGRDGNSGIDLTHVIDASGAYVPGHGTPTVILFGRNRKPVIKTIRAAMGIRGEPTTPDDPARGLVWSAIVSQIDQPGSSSDFVSVADAPREFFQKHPWSIGGGGAAELKDQLEEVCASRLEDLIDEAGVFGMTNADEVMLAPLSAFARRAVESLVVRRLALGDEVRDWSIKDGDGSLFPYRGQILMPIADLPGMERWLWPCRTVLGSRATFSRQTYFEEGRPWWEWHQVALRRLRTPLSIIYGEVATHNHFALDRGGTVFNRTAPIIKLPPGSSEEVHLALLGILNSSTTCFWMRQVCFPKGGDHVGQEGARVRRSLWDERYAFNATNLEKFPLPEGRPTELARHLDYLAQALAANSPRAVIARWQAQPAPEGVREQSLGEFLDEAYAVSVLIRGQMILMQEDLDWQCYRLYGLIDEDVIMGIQPQDERHSILPGMRAFEVLLAQDVVAGKTQTTWFERHGITPRTELPNADFNPKYREIAQRRIEIIRTNPQIALIEQPDYKRRWYEDIWGNQRDEALRDWLLNRLESYFDHDGRMNDQGQATAKVDVGITSTARLAQVAEHDVDFMRVGDVLRGDMAFDVHRLVAELVEAESVPLLPVLRYKASGLRKRAEWEQTWDLQRRQDELAAQRDAARRVLQQERERVASSLAAEKADVEALSVALWKECIEVRDRFARGFELPQTADPCIAVGVLGQHGVAFEGGAALMSLQTSRERLHQKVIDFDAAVWDLCKKDAEYQAAAARYNAIPPDPDIAVPPKYTSADFLKGDGWRLRGKLDVPKERWVSFPHCEGPDGTLAIAWAGYDHLQLATAIGQYFQRIKDELGGHDDPRLVPLLACMLELIPWLKQWHNEPDANFGGLRLGDHFEDFVMEEARQLNKTIPEIKAWQPPQKTASRGRRKTTT